MYEQIMTMAQHCHETAERVENVEMKRFWYNAEQGFKKKALLLKIENAGVKNEKRGEA